ncbi:MAG: hypothetical protein ACK4GJ_00810 [bacterium]
MIEKVNNIPKGLFVFETKGISNHIQRAIEIENKNQQFSDAFKIRDLDKDEENYVKSKIKSYANYNIV